MTLSKSVLLISPHFSAEDRYGKNVGSVGAMVLPTLGLAYVAAVLEKIGFRVQILDAAIENMTKEDVIQFILKDNPDIVGINCFTPSYFRVQELVQDPRIKDFTIILGGPHPTILPKEVMEENPAVNFIIIGEGEETIPELMHAIEKKSGFENIKGIAYRKNSEIVINERRPLIKDLDTIPLPARHLLDLKKYEAAPSTQRRSFMTNIISTRGCPYRCTYCSSRNLFGVVHRTHSVQRVIKEIKICLDTGAREIYFLDDNFSANRAWTMKLCDEIIKQGLHKKFIWSMNTRVNLIDEELLRKMKMAGMYLVHFGVESGSQRLLDMIKKDITLEQSDEAIKLCRRIGVNTRSYGMLGLPTETREESEKTIRFLKKINPTTIKVSLLTPYPGSPVFSQIKNELKVKDWRAWTTMGGFVGNEERPYVPAGRTSAELNELQRRAHREFYLRPKKILELILNIRTWYELKVTIKSFLALIKMKKKVNK